MSDVRGCASHTDKRTSNDDRYNRAAISSSR
jgi:hypothetical protein